MGNCLFLFVCFFCVDFIQVVQISTCLEGQRDKWSFLRIKQNKWFLSIWTNQQLLIAYNNIPLEIELSCIGKMKMSI